MPQIARTPPQPPAGCLWIDDAADYVGLTKNTLYKYRHRTLAGVPTGPVSFAVGRKVAYEISELDVYLDGLKNPAPAPSRETRPPESRRAVRKHRTPAVA